MRSKRVGGGDRIQREPVGAAGQFFTTPGFSDEEMHTFLATELTPGESHPDEDEVIEPVTVPLTLVRELIEKGEIRDAKTITSLLLVLERTERDG